MENSSICSICEIETNNYFIYCENSHFICSVCYTILKQKICPYCRGHFDEECVQRFRSTQEQTPRVISAMSRYADNDSEREFLARAMMRCAENKNDKCLTQNKLGCKNTKTLITQESAEEARIYLYNMKKNKNCIDFNNRLL